MSVKSLSFTNVGPFDEVEFEFDPQVNVFTGPNNSGKSSALWVLGDVLVYPFSFPDKLLRPETNASFEFQLCGDSDSKFSGQLPMRWSGAHDGGEEHWTEEWWRNYRIVLTTIGYSKFIPALRRSTDFRSTGPTLLPREDNEFVQLPLRGDNRSFSQRRSRRADLARRRRTAGQPLEPELEKRLALISDNASLVSDEAVIQEIIDLDYRSYVRKKTEFRDIIDKIGAMASEITEGFPITFSGIGEDDGGFFPQFDTVDGAMPFNTLSQGTQSIIQWLAHLLIGYAEYYDFPENVEDKPGILIIDEIDAHLHPAWQRRIIPTLTDHFPNLQIFCSTHSPLMLAGLREGQVQLLQRDEKGKITVTKNEVDITGWTADEILRNFLGVRDPTDLVAVERLERLNDLETKEVLSAEEEGELEKLRHTVSRDLMGGPHADIVKQFSEELRKARVSSDTSAKPSSSPSYSPRTRRNHNE